MSLAAEIEDARSKLEALERRAAAATCAEIGKHDWQLEGGHCCDCPDGSCSLPVYVCARCNDCDYGDNPEADHIKTDCEAGEA